VAYYNGRRISLAEARSMQQPSAEPTRAQRFTNAAEVAARSRESDVQTNVATLARSERSTESSAQPKTENESSVAARLPEFAENWSDRKGVWLTVQIGVYSKPVSLSDLYNVSNVMAEVLDRGMVRYTTGRFNALPAALAAKDAARAAGISDAFITAYIDGKRVSLAEAESRLANGAQSTPQISTQTTPPVETVPATMPETGYRLRIGAIDGQVPAATARALLLLEAKWGIRQSTDNAQTTYFSRTLSTKAEAERAAADFRELGAERLEVQELGR